MIKSNSKLAKEIGAYLKNIRINKRHPLHQISKATSIPVHKILCIEEGRIYSFNNNFSEYINYSIIYSNAIGVDINHLIRNESKSEELHFKFIPDFLRKKDIKNIR
jgi:cytoskeletal protein RodZ